ncbi:MAG: fimbrillin family protein [Candidatus Cryptobacteroides sp.]|nr:fimbrillin family protein [Candidatus Cryptobacteroides sp.]
MKKFCLFICVAALCAVSCSKASQPVEDPDKWVNDESQRVPVQFASRTQVETKAIKDGRIDGITMNGLDVGVIAVAKKQSDGTPVTWSSTLDGSILIDNTKVTTSEAGDIAFSPAVYYPFGNVYAYSFYSYYPYTNAAREAAANVDGVYSITYDLGNTDILWANSEATDYAGLKGFNAKYCRAVRQAGEQNNYFPKLQYHHLLTAIVFKVQGKDATIGTYDLNVTGVRILNTSTKATLKVADSQGQSGVLTGNEDGGSIGFDNLNVPITTVASDACTILAMPASSYSAQISFDKGGDSSVLNIANADGEFKAGFIYYFTVKVNNPEDVTIIATGLDEWQPGTTPGEGEVE